MELSAVLSTKISPLICFLILWRLQFLHYLAAENSCGANQTMQLHRLIWSVPLLYASAVNSVSHKALHLHVSLWIPYMYILLDNLIMSHMQRLDGLVASTAVHSKAMVLFLLIHCELLLPLFTWLFLCLVLVLTVVSFLVLHLSCGEERAGCFTLIALWCHVAVSILCFVHIVSWVGLQCEIVAFPGHTH